MNNLILCGVQEKIMNDTNKKFNKLFVQIKRNTLNKIII